MNRVILKIVLLFNSFSYWNTLDGDFWFKSLLFNLWLFLFLSCFEIWSISRKLNEFTHYSLRFLFGYLSTHSIKTQYEFAELCQIKWCYAKIIISFKLFPQLYIQNPLLVCIIWSPLKYETYFFKHFTSMKEVKFLIIFHQMILMSKYRLTYIFLKYVVNNSFRVIWS